MRFNNLIENVKKNLKKRKEQCNPVIPKRRKNCLDSLVQCHRFLEPNINIKNIYILKQMKRY